MYISSSIKTRQVWERPFPPWGGTVTSRYEHTYFLSPFRSFTFTLVQYLGVWEHITSRHSRSQPAQRRNANALLSTVRAVSEDEEWHCLLPLNWLFKVLSVFCLFSLNAEIYSWGWSRSIRDYMLINCRLDRHPCSSSYIELSLLSSQEMTNSIPR